MYNEIDARMEMVKYALHAVVSYARYKTPLVPAWPLKRYIRIQQEHVMSPSAIRPKTTDDGKLYNAVRRFAFCTLVHRQPLSGVVAD